MVSTRKQKQALAAASDPLRDAGILQHVLAFLPGNWLILGAVCREWNAAYAGMADQQLCGFNVHSVLDTRIVKRKTVICGRKTTLFSAAVASPAVARRAHSCGLMMCDQFQLMAGLHADIETLTVLRQLRMPLSDIVIIAVALSGRLNTLQQLLRAPQCPRVKPSVLSHYAARSGSISMLNWLKVEGLCCFDQDTCLGAAEGGQLAALQHLRSEGCAWDEKSIAGCAAMGGSIELIDWVLQQQGIELNAEAMKLAAGAGQIAMCDHLRSLGCEWNTDACTWAASNDLDVLRWLREHGCPWDFKGVCMSAAITDRVEVLDYYIEQGEVLSAEQLTAALNHAGLFNQLRAAQWLRQHGAEWPSVLAVDGHYLWDCGAVAWARAQGCTSPVPSFYDYLSDDGYYSVDTQAQ
jgi:hypothetical protein